MTACTFDGEFFVILYFFEVFLADIVAIGANEFFGSVFAPGSLYFFGAGCFEKIDGYFMVLAFFIFFILELKFSDFRDIYF